MGALFSPPKPKIVMSPPPPPVPTIDQAARDEQTSRQVRRRIGYRANMRGIVGGGEGGSGSAGLSAPSTAVRQLLGGT